MSVGPRKDLGVWGTGRLPAHFGKITQEPCSQPLGPEVMAVGPSPPLCRSEYTSWVLRVGLRSQAESDEVGNRTLQGRNPEFPFQ